jgi:hypothetical protein
MCALRGGTTGVPPRFFIRPGIRIGFGCANPRPTPNPNPDFDLKTGLRRGRGRGRGKSENLKKCSCVIIKGSRNACLILSIMYILSKQQLPLMRWDLDMINRIYRIKFGYSNPNPNPTPGLKP